MFMLMPMNFHTTYAHRYNHTQHITTYNVNTWEKA